jgi:hypothetical protein
MRLTVLLVLGTALTLAACGGGASPGSTPEESLEGFRQALASRDYESAIDFAPPKELESFRKEFDKVKPSDYDEIAKEMKVDVAKVKDMSFEELLAASLEAACERSPDRLDVFLNGKVVDKQIDDDDASFKLEKDDQDRTIRVRLKQENGKWYVEDFGIR